MTDRPSEGPFERRDRPGGTDPGRLGTVVFGLVILAVGLWFFAERTLGIDLPNVDWGTLWPVVLIGIGAWILLGAMRSRR